MDMHSELAKQGFVRVSDSPKLGLECWNTSRGISSPTRGCDKRHSREENMFYDIVTHPLAHPIVIVVGLIVIVGWAWWWWRKV
jgi:hypothetical protein